MDKLAVIYTLQSLGTKQRAETNARFFKTGKGEYGEGDVFWGITVPQIRQVAKQYCDLPLPEIVSLLCHKVHEVRLCAIFLLVMRFPKDPKSVYDAYLANTRYINNWDLVDSSAEYIVGAYLENKSKDELTKLAKSKSIWERRISILSTFHYIKQGKPQEALSIAEILINDDHDLIQKAVGWMLREVGKRCPLEIEEQFLDIHATNMPRTALSYAVERFSADKKAYYRSLKNQLKDKPIKPKVYLLCGLPGSGKSTFSSKLQKQDNSVSYSSDEWIINLFGQEFSPEKFEKYQAIARQKILEAAKKEILQGKSIILDFGFWKKDDRTKYINWAKLLNAQTIIYFFDIDTETLIKRLDRRNQKKENKSLIVTKEMLHKFIDQFEPPINKEAEIIEVKK